MADSTWVKARTKVGSDTGFVRLRRAVDALGGDRLDLHHLPLSLTMISRDRELEDVHPSAEGDEQGTWNTPQAIARHRRMSPEERLRCAVELSRAALRFAGAQRADGR